ncbi:hypothetical protein FB45DRAFT_1058017 [Roridomyces roridus]|uniref:Polymerase nucleotidyl transferase domain-containing protein n=1 Tax=Roridomyces roridus TaxID=1738132 RepID=A0AAD7FQX5_9AGAR|nr:hypothetical protein FB45DRAFT_1058017 [Roridomyces roridus]
MTPTHISEFLHTLQIPTKVQTVYLVGSRLWGTHTPKSDFDLLVVIRDSTKPFQKSQHRGHYDATILTESSFCEQVKEGALIECLCCLISEEEDGVRLLNDSSSQPCRSLVDLDKMRRWVAERREKDMEKASKFWAKGGSREKGWKILQHAISAESILRGLEKMVEGEKIGDVVLTKEMVQRFVAGGQDEDDRAWLGWDWGEVREAHAKRIQGPK